jgi:hypothetical protein
MSRLLPYEACSKSFETSTCKFINLIKKMMII